MHKFFIIFLLSLFFLSCEKEQDERNSNIIFYSVSNTYTIYIDGLDYGLITPITGVPTCEPTDPFGGTLNVINFYRGTRKKVLFKIMPEGESFERDIAWDQECKVYKVD